jgi:hypothetical protein
MFVGFLKFFRSFHNQALHSEVGSLGIILQKIQETVTNMNQEVSKGSDFDIEYTSLYF